MDRRDFLASIAAVPAVAAIRDDATDAAGDRRPPARTPPPPASRPRARSGGLPRGKITRVRIYEPPNLNRLFNQSNMLCTVETDFGITGIGEGGSKDTLEQCAGTLIGKDPFKIEAIWQEMFIAWFYPPGREKTHALGRDGHGAVGHQGQGARPAAARAARRQRPQLLRVLRHDHRAARRRTASRGRSPIAPRRPWTPAIAPSAWARPTCRSAASTTRTTPCAA